MYKITRTMYVITNVKKKVSDDVIFVEDIDKHRESLMSDEYERVNFVYQEVSDNEHQGEYQSD